MDIKREGVAEAKRKRRIVYGAIALAVVALVTLGLYRLEPAAPSVDARHRLARHRQAGRDAAAGARAGDPGAGGDPPHRAQHRGDASNGA